MYLITVGVVAVCAVFKALISSFKRAFYKQVKRNGWYERYSQRHVLGSSCVRTKEDNRFLQAVQPWTLSIRPLV